MKKVLISAALLCSAAAMAQEIGTELPPESQRSTPPPTTYDNPYGTPPPPAQTQPAQAAQPAQDEGGVPGPRAGAFGLRASFSGSGVPGAPTSGSDPGAAAPTIGMRVMATDSMAINFDLGLAMGIGSRIALGFGAGFGIQAYLGSAEKPIRPFFLGEARFGKSFDATGRGWSLGFNVGGGGEYFFSDYFSLEGRALIGVPLNLDAFNAFTFATFQPGLGANFYF